jgi:putative AlgH/UPF0301 family transcriptional regulator
MDPVQDATSTLSVAGGPPAPGASGPVCRFCLEDASESLDGNEDMRLVTPCACRGTAALVHLSCLRKWQSSLLGHRVHRDSIARAASCPVCTQPLIVDGVRLEPEVPAPAQHIGPGTLLVATENLEGEGRIFHHSVILVCKACESGRVHGVDISREAESSDPVKRAAAFAFSSGGSNVNLEVRVYLGGPVCGGRLGVTQYIALSSLQELNGDSAPVLPNPAPSGSKLFAPDPWQGKEARAAADLLRQAFDYQVATPTGLRELLMFFRGHAAWGRGQLEAEIHRGNWATCLAQSEDILVTPGHHLWSHLRESGRLTRVP